MTKKSPIHHTKTHMPKICYQPKKFNAASAEKIRTANQIIRDYAEQGFELTLRQLYYQFVARDLIPNTQREYKNLGSILNDARLAGLVDWDAIVDRTRYLRHLSHWTSPESIVATCAEQFRVDKWENQPNHVEVWIEKDALVGVIESVCEADDVPFFSCRGYTSQSELWSAARRLAVINRRKPSGECVVLHLGDHDPSGIDMTRDIADRMAMFGASVDVRRIALNMDQVEEYNPPPNPAKITDSRAESYIAAHGAESWELDALEPKTIVELVRGQIEALKDADIWEEDCARERQGRTELRSVANNWRDVVDGLAE